jgi:hypothetical protein
MTGLEKLKMEKDINAIVKLELMKEIDAIVSTIERMPLTETDFRCVTVDLLLRVMVQVLEDHPPQSLAARGFIRGYRGIAALLPS